MFENKDILDLLKRDKERGIKMLFDMYYRPLVLFANELIHDVVIAEDIVQELFVKLWQGSYLTKVSAGALPSYLYTCVKNSCITRISKRDILSESESFNGLDIPMEEINSINDRQISEIENAFLALPTQTRNVMEAVIIKELKYQEAAEELNISINTLKTLLKRGVKKLREKVPIIILLFLIKFVTRFYS